MEKFRSYKLRTEVLLLFEDAKDSLGEYLQIYNMVCWRNRCVMKRKTNNLRFRIIAVSCF